MRTRAYGQRVAYLALAMAPWFPANAQSYTISTVAGAGVPWNVAGTAANLVSGVPTFLVADPSGNVYFSDQNSVIEWNAGSGVLTVVAGNNTTGYSGDNGPAVSAQLNNPQGLALDSSGALYIADTGNYVIRKVYQGTIATVAGNGKQATTCATGPALSTALNSPYGMAFDAAGDLYFSEPNLHCVRKISSGVMTIAAGTGASGFKGDGGPATSALLSGTAGIAFDSSGNLYMVDNTRIREVAAATGIITTVAGGSGKVGAQYGGPALTATVTPDGGIAVDSSGNFYFSNGASVSKVSGGILTTVTGSVNVETQGNSGDGGPATSALLDDPAAIAFDGAGNLYIADAGANRIREVSAGTISTIVGNSSNGDGGLATEAPLGPVFLALDAQGDLYMKDGFADAVRKVAAASGIISTVAGVPTSSAGVAVDSAGDVYTTSLIGAVIFKTSNGQASIIAGNGNQGYSNNTVATEAPLWAPYGIAVDASGNIYFSNSTQFSPNGDVNLETPAAYVQKIANGTLTTIAGDGAPGYGGDGQSGLNAAVNAPTGVALDSAGDVFVMDAGNQRIREISAQTGVIQTVAGSGNKGYSGDGGLAIDADLDLVRNEVENIVGGVAIGLAVDQAGNIYIADTNNYRVRKVSAATGVITTIAGNGTSGFSGDYGPATSAELTYPAGIAVDAAGNVFIADGPRVRVLTPSTATGCTFAVSSNAISAAAAGGIETVNVQTTAYCPWTISGLPSWIAIGGVTPGGTGPGVANLSIASNTGAARSATIQIGGAAVTVSQAGTTVGPSIALVANAESQQPVVAPNTWVEIKGTDLAPAGDTRIWASSDFLNGQMPTDLDGVGVTVNGTAAYIYYISPTQVNILTPPGPLSGPVDVVLTNSTASAPFPVQAQAESPSFFVFNGGPYVAATHLDGSLIGPATLYPGYSTPAAPGETIVIYANGFGATSAPVVAGAVTQSGTLSPLPAITIGGVAATVQYAGSSGAPGEFQFNVVVPASIAGTGDQPIAATYDGQSTQSGTLITIQ